jgi:hypothetical protein
MVIVLMVDRSGDVVQENNLTYTRSFSSIFKLNVKRFFVTEHLVDRILPEILFSFNS